MMRYCFRHPQQSQAELFEGAYPLEIPPCASLSRDDGIWTELSTRHPELSTRHPERSTRHPERSTRHPERSTRHPERSRGVSSILFVCLLLSCPVFAQDEIAEPIATEEVAPPTPTTGPEDPSAAGDQETATNPEDEKQGEPQKANEEEIWETYDDFQKKGEDLSSQLSVKDIIETSNDYTYASFGKPNPFVPPLMSTFLATMEIPIVSVLQRHPVHQLAVRGIWQLENGEKKSLVITPKDEGVVTSIGDPIGQKGGKVIKIEQDRIKVREFTLAPDGTRQFEDVELTLGGEQVEKEEDKIIIKASRPGLAERSELGKDFLESSDQEERRKSLHFKQSQEVDAQQQTLQKTDEGIEDVEQALKNMKKTQQNLPAAPATALPLPTPEH